MTFDIGLNFDNTYSNLSSTLITNINPTPVKSPKLIILNKELAKYLDLNFDSINKLKLASLLSGNLLPKGSKCIAQAYAGHQFGYLNILGDGRAILIGEHITKKNKRYDLQFKGSGKTPYSRNGDGRATLLSMLREYIISEAMHGLNIPTTRSLSVVSTGEDIQRGENLMGGILTRVASSHIRVGTFQYLAMQGDKNNLSKLIDYSLKRHYPDEPVDVNSAITLLKSVRDRQISLIINWMRVGFIHGVMNTDNMTISGETIDYGPCAFMDTYNPHKVFSSIDQNGRYSFINQSIIAHWNISRFAETLIPFLDKSKNKAIEIGKEIINEFEGLYKDKWIKMMGRKLGFVNSEINDLDLIQNLLKWMEKNNADYTNTFIHIMDENKFNEDIYKHESFFKIKKQIDLRKKLNQTNREYDKELFNKKNPLIVPRNHIVEKVLMEIHTHENYDLFNKLLEILKNPYLENDNINIFQNRPDKIFEKNHKTYCGT